MAKEYVIRDGNVYEVNGDSFWVIASEIKRERIRLDDTYVEEVEYVYDISTGQYVERFRLKIEKPRQNAAASDESTAEAVSETTEQ